MQPICLERFERFDRLDPWKVLRAVLCCAVRWVAGIGNFSGQSDATDTRRAGT